MAPRYYRRVIRITAMDSPNVRWAMAQQAAGEPVTNEIITPGVLTWDQYRQRRATWDKVRQTIGLDGEFYEGAQVLLYPKEWLDNAARVDLVDRCLRWPTEAIGIDPAEGGDKTAFAAVNRYGLKELISRQTPDTNAAYHEMKEFIRRHGMDRTPAKVCLDRGGGGKEHADRLRAGGLAVRTVAFGESLVPDPVRRTLLIEEKLEQREEHYAYRNRRAEMYGTLRLLLDPGNLGQPVGDVQLLSAGFALPGGDERDPHCPFGELRRQLAIFPLEYDDESRMTLPPKHRKPGQEETARKTLEELIGHSPDEADALVLAVHGMVSKARRMVAGAR